MFGVMKLQTLFYRGVKIRPNSDQLSGRIFTHNLGNFPIVGLCQTHYGDTHVKTVQVDSVT